MSAIRPAHHTGKVAIGRAYVPKPLARNAGSVSGPHRRPMDAYEWAAVGAAVIGVMTLVGWLL